MEASFNLITLYNDNINCHINVDFYHLSNEICSYNRFGVTSQNIIINNDKTIETVNLLQVYIMIFLISVITRFLTL